MINYVKSAQSVRDPNGSGNITKYTARVYSRGNVSMDLLASEISHATTLSYPDMVAALKAFEIHVQNHIQAGDTVKLDYLGTFYPKIKSKAFDNIDEVSAEGILRKTCRFLPSKTFRRAINNTPVKMIVAHENQNANSSTATPTTPSSN